MSQEKLKVAVVQHSCTDDVEANQQQVRAGIEQAAKQGAKLILLPELHNTLYFCQTEDTRNFDLAETIPGPSTQMLSELADDHEVVIVASLFEKRAPGLYHNTTVVMDADGSLAGTYRKMHIPDDPGFYEKFYFTPGDMGFSPIATSVGKLGVMICWDQWFPEAARLMAMAGAEILLYPTAIGWDPRDSEEERKRQKDAWVTVQRAHAIANGLPVMVANRTGHEADPSGQTAGIRFWGNSFVCGPQGEMLVQARQEHPTIFSTEVDFKRTESVRRMWPFFRDRRTDSYYDLIRQYID